MASHLFLAQLCSFLKINMRYYRIEYLKTTHLSHPNIIKRLKKAEGHLRGIVAMLKDDRSSLEVAQQLQAVEKAIVNAKKALVHDHLDHCLDVAVGVDTEKSKVSVQEFKEITKYL